MSADNIFRKMMFYFGTIPGCGSYVYVADITISEARYLLGLFSLADFYSAYARTLSS